MAECAKGVYHQRRPRESAFYRVVEEHYERFEQVYPDRYEHRYGFLRPVIRETVYKYLGCGDLKQGFARDGATSERGGGTALPPLRYILPERLDYRQKVAQRRERHYIFVVNRAVVPLTYCINAVAEDVTMLSRLHLIDFVFVDEQQCAVRGTLAEICA